MHQPITRFYSEEAKDLVKLGTTIVENVGSIDNSPPERVPHEEYMGKELAKARLLMPLKIVNLENKVENIETKLNNLNKNTTELILSLKNAFNTLAANKLTSSLDFAP